MPNGPESQPGVEEDAADKEEEGSEDEWEQVGPRNKISITRQADFVRTPITDIFGGHIRYVDSKNEIRVFCLGGESMTSELLDLIRLGVFTVFYALLLRGCVTRLYPLVAGGFYSGLIPPDLSR